MEKLFFPDDIICKLEIDQFDSLIIRKSPQPRFYLDDVYIEVLTQGKRLLVLEDSFEYAAYTSLCNSVHTIINVPTKAIECVFGAPCDKGGLELYFENSELNMLKLKVIKHSHLIDNLQIIKYSKRVEHDQLMKWIEKLEEIYSNRHYIFNN